jgi:hypothetical protein
MGVLCGDRPLREAALSQGMRGATLKAVLLPAPCAGPRLAVVARDAAPGRPLRVCGLAMLAPAEAAAG